MRFPSSLARDIIDEFLTPAGSGSLWQLRWSSDYECNFLVLLASTSVDTSDVEVRIFCWELDLCCFNQVLEYVEHASIAQPCPHMLQSCSHPRTLDPLPVNNTGSEVELFWTINFIEVFLNPRAYQNNRTSSNLMIGFSQRRTYSLDKSLLARMTGYESNQFRICHIPHHCWLHTTLLGPASTVSFWIWVEKWKTQWLVLLRLTHLAIIVTIGSSDSSDGTPGWNENLLGYKQLPPPEHLRHKDDWWNRKWLESLWVYFFLIFWLWCFYFHPLLALKNTIFCWETLWDRFCGSEAQRSKLDLSSSRIIYICLTNTHKKS